MSGPPIYYLLTFSNYSQLISNEYSGCISGCYFGLICFTEAFADLWHVMKEGSNTSLCQLTSSHKLSLRSAHELHWQSLITVTTRTLQQQQACFSQARASQPCPRAPGRAACLKRWQQLLPSFPSIFLYAVAIVGILNDVHCLEFQYT